MKASNPFSRFRSKNEPSTTRPVFQPTTSRHLDRKLLQQARVRYIPSFRQLKYVGRFLSTAEKKTVRFLLRLSCVILICSLGFFLFKHIETTPAAGGEYSEGFVGQPKFLNPLFSSTNEVDSDISALVYSQLFTYNEKRELVPDLAEKYTVSDDHKIYDVVLKPHLKWSDGEPLDATDVVFTFETIQNPEVGSPLAAAFQGVKIEKINDLTVRFTLKQAFAPFIHTLVTGIIPEHVWSAIDNPSHIKLAKNNLEPLGSGPWQFDRLVKRDGGGIEALSLIPNKNYNGPTPQIEKFTLRFFSDQSSMLEALKTRKILAISFPPRLNTSSTPAKNLHSYSVDLPQYTALFFNLDLNPFLKDKNLRIALTAAIDKKNIVAEVLRGNAKIIESPILPGMIGYSESLSTITTTLDEANQLLDKTWQRIQPEEYFALRTDELKKERGTIDARTKKVSTTPEIDAQILSDVKNEMSPTQTFYRRDKKNQLLSLTITTVDTPEYQKVAQHITKNWQSLGVKTAIKSINRQFFLRNVIKNRDYDTVLYGEVVGGDPDPFPFWHSSQVNYPGLNLSLYSNRTVDTLLENARATVNPVERAKLYTTFEQTLLNDAPAVFLYTPLYSILISTDVKNVAIPTIVLPSDRYKLFANWYIKTHWKWK